MCTAAVGAYRPGAMLQLQQRFLRMSCKLVMHFSPALQGTGPAVKQLGELC